MEPGGEREDEGTVLELPIPLLRPFLLSKCSIDVQDCRALPLPDYCAAKSCIFSFLASSGGG